MSHTLRVSYKVTHSICCDVSQHLLWCVTHSVTLWLITHRGCDVSLTVSLSYRKMPVSLTEEDDVEHSVMCHSQRLCCVTHSVTLLWCVTHSVTMWFITHRCCDVSLTVSLSHSDVSLTVSLCCDVSLTVSLCDASLTDAECVTHMGWLRLAGSSKLLVSFAEYSLVYRALYHSQMLRCVTHTP